jgi:hypothetical protein
LLFVTDAGTLSAGALLSRSSCGRVGEKAVAIGDRRLGHEEDGATGVRDERERNVAQRRQKVADETNVETRERSSPWPRTRVAPSRPSSGAVAQWSEQGTHNPWVVGSIPTGPTSSEG